MITFKRKNDQANSSVVLDTSGIIDGRILEIAKAGFVPQHIIVAQFVIAELQFLADHGDTHKRERARYGLDVIRRLQEVNRIEVSIAREKFEHIREVDDKLVALAKQYSAFLYTTDFNLNKVAQIEGVAVLNVNELAHALRPNLLPGERVTIKLTQVGQDKTQGVGYLSDGTMVVVEQAGRLIGQQVQAVCTRILQTQAGKMMFATLATKPQPQQENKPREQIQQHVPVQQQPQKKQQMPSTSEGKPQLVQKHTAQPKQRQYKKQQHTNKKSAGAEKPETTNERQRPQRRRVSPEDSLLATLKEIQN